MFIKSSGLYPNLNVTVLSFVIYCTLTFDQMFLQLSPIWESIRETHALFMIHGRSIARPFYFLPVGGGGGRGDPTSAVTE